MNEFNRLRQYIGKASFSHGADRASALECVDRITDRERELGAALLATLGALPDTLDFALVFGLAWLETL